ncbi:MAG: hypothetical protein ACM3MK_08775 [Chitinophagales bacterium]
MNINNRPRFIIVTLLAGFIWLLAGSSPALASPPTFQWIKTFDNSGCEMAQLEDGSVIMVSGEDVTQVDIFGNTVWKKTFADTFINNLCIDKKQGIVLLTRCSLIGLDSYGNQLWEKNLPESIKSNDDEPTRICVTRDGGYILCKMKGDRPLLVKLNEQGDQEWSSIIDFSTELSKGKNTSREITGLIASRTGGYIIIGNKITEVETRPDPISNITYSSYRDGFILKTDAAGHKKSELALDRKGHIPADSVLETVSGDLVVGGSLEVNQNLNQVCLLNINNNGKIEWKTTWPFQSYSDYVCTVDYIGKARDSGYLILAGPEILKVDKNGKKEWAVTTPEINDTITETAKGYLVAGCDFRPPGIYKGIICKLSKNSEEIRSEDIDELPSDEKQTYLINRLNLQISQLNQYIDDVKQGRITTKQRKKIDDEIAEFEKTTDKIQLELKLQLVGVRDWLWPKYWDLKPEYEILAESKIDKHLFLPDVLQKKYGNTHKVSGAKFDGIIVSKNGYQYNLDLGNVKKYTIKDDRIEIVTNKKTYFVSNYDEAFSTSVGLGMYIGEYEYVFDTHRFKKPVDGDLILVNDVIRYLLDQPKRTSLKYKDLVITRESKGVYNVTILRGKEIDTMPGWTREGYTVYTKGPNVVQYDILTDNGYINDHKAILMYDSYTYKVTF